MCDIEQYLFAFYAINLLLYTVIHILLVYIIIKNCKASFLKADLFSYLTMHNGVIAFSYLRLALFYGLQPEPSMRLPLQA